MTIALPPRSTLRQNVGGVVLCTVLAGLADWFAPTIFTGHSLVLGLVFYWIAARQYGSNAAILPLVASMVVLTTKWSQPYSSSLIALEGLWVSWHWERGRNALAADLWYWLLFGTPLSLFLYKFVYVIPSPSFEEALVVQVVNGIVAIWIAVVAVGLLPNTTVGARPEAPQNFRTFLVHRIATFGVFPVLIAGMLVVRQMEKSAIADAKERITADAVQLAATLGRVLSTDVEAVRAVAVRASAMENFGQTDTLKELLGLAQATGAKFSTMLAADATGMVVARAANARFQSAPAPDPRVSVADRDYFSEPMKSGLPYVSGAFRGRGYFADVVVAVSAPVTSGEGQRIGIIEGSFIASTLAEFLQSNVVAPNWRALLSDQSQKVIAAHGFDLTPLQSLQHSHLRALLDHPKPTPTRFTDDVRTERISFFSVTVPVPNTRWQLTLQRPWAEVTNSVMRAYTVLLIVATLAGLAAVLFTTWSIRDPLLAWKCLIEFARDPLSRAGDLNRFNKLYLPIEFHELKRNLAAMTERLASEKREREALLAELESRVKARTAELERALVAAQSADRAKSAFLATVSHELRTPLTAIVTGTRLLKIGTHEKTDMEKRTLLTLEKSSQVLMGVISNVLDYSKLEAGGVDIVNQPFLPAALVSDVAIVFTHQAQQAGLSLEHSSRHSPDLLWLGDMARIRQVLVNLTGNAIKFTASGSVTISSWTTEATHDVPARLWFCVQDTGPGIPEDKLGSIFEPFVQLETNRLVSQAGTGLGLPISLKLVHMMGGEITVTSRVGVGSKFEFWLPAK